MASAAFNRLAAAVATYVGIDVIVGKCEVWSRNGGEASPSISERGPDDVWRGNKPEENGLVVLGALLGRDRRIH